MFMFLSIKRAIRHMRLKATAITLVLCLGGLFSASLPAAAQVREKPLWELGAGVGYISIPDYLGSDESRNYILPYPFVIYRGRIFRAEDNVATGRFFNNEIITVETSFYGSVPVSSDDNEAREGMPDLDPTFELGPSLKIKLFSSADKTFKLDLNLPTRMVFSTDFKSIGYEGLIFCPRLTMAKEDLFPGTGIDLGISAGPTFANRKYHRYFYEVAPEYTTPTRKAYTPTGGYTGTSFLVSMGKRISPFFFRAFFSIDYLHGTDFKDSPLVREKSSLMGGFSLTWIFRTSEETVVVED